MLNLEQIRKGAESEIHIFDRFLIREYLQCKILEIIYQTDYASKLIFMGGTNLRIIHGNRRFSEDLDFDNRGVTDQQWSHLTAHIEENLALLGLIVEVREVKKKAWHIYIKFPNLLFNYALSGYETEKILIQVDAESQEVEYEPKLFLLNKWDVTQLIQIVPLPTLMAQKCYALINRKREKGRDLFDLAFLMSLNIKPDYSYLQQKIGAENGNQLKEMLLNRLQQISLQDMARDVEPFLFGASEIKKVLFFTLLVENYSW